MKQYSESPTEYAEAIIRYNHFDEDNDDFIPLGAKEYIESLDDTNYFAKRLLIILNEKYENFYCEDESTTRSFIQNKCKENGVDSLSRQTLSNWLTTKSPDGNSISRENVFKLCFGLDFSLRETEELFVRGYFERPFNFRKVKECAYYFCLNRHLSYSSAIELIEEINDRARYNNNKDSIYTSRIGEEINHLKSKADFVSYMSENYSAFTVDNTSGKKKVRELVEKCKRCFNKMNNWEGVDAIQTNKDLLQYIYGRSIRNDEKDAEFKSLSKSGLPRIIKKNIPQDQQLSNIERPESVVSYDAIRKALIFFDFFYYFGQGNSDSVEFRKEANYILNECGYAQLYPWNPYDWMFCYCADQGENAIDAFEAIMQEYCKE